MDTINHDASIALMKKEQPKSIFKFSRRFAMIERIAYLYGSSLGLIFDNLATTSFVWLSLKKNK